MDKREKLLLIDGHSIVNRAFYGVPALTNSKGLHTNAIMGFLNIFFTVYNKYKPEYIIIAFDVKEKTFRHLMYDAYKGTRKGMPDELHEQVPVLQEVLKSMNIKIATLPGYEADDILGTYAKMAEKEGKDVVIVSGDRDILQIASETTMIAIPKTKSGGTEVEHYYAKDVEEKYQVDPKAFIDLKALMGDSSDNIPGVPGIGEKTATNIIVKFGSLENAIEHADEITPNRAKENLKANVELARLSKVLATINTESPVKFSYAEGKTNGPADFFNGESYKIYKELELNKLLSKFDLEKIDEPSDIVYDVKDASEFEEAGVGEKAGIYVAPGRELFAVSEGEKTVVYKGFSEGVKALLNSDRDISCFALKDILHAVEAEDIRNDRISDLEIMAYILNPIGSSYGFDISSKEYLGKIVPSKEDLLAKKSFEAIYAKSPEKCELLAALSAYTAVNAKDKVLEALSEAGMDDLFTAIEMPLVFSLYYMEKEGVKVDAGALSKFSAQLEEIAQGLQKEIYEEAGTEFNINSPQQLGNVLFETLKLPSGKKTKTGYSTSADVLEKLAGDYPIVTKILKYRQVVKLRSTYAEGLPSYISADGRIHGTFNQTITATGRISSTEPNLQNIPIRMELGQEIRKAFIAKEGCVFLDADYSQIELRLLAHLSDDRTLIEAYHSDADIHKITASKVFNTPLDEVTKEQRRNAKAVNFGIVYGISSFGLGQDLNISRKEANQYIKQYFETYPGVKEYLDVTVKQAKINGYTTTMFGRRRPIPELASTNFMQRSFGERAAMNSPIQGSAADIMKIAMINVERALLKEELKARIVLQVHDELLVETPVEEIETVKALLEREMKNAAKVSVPLEVEVEEGKDWFEAH